MSTHHFSNTDKEIERVESNKRVHNSNEGFGGLAIENVSLQRSFAMDIRNRQVDIDEAQHLSAFCIVGKQSFRSVFGHVYYLEKKMISGKKMYSLFGGGINFTEIDRVVQGDEQSSWALVRELDEEIGTIGNKGGRKFAVGDISPVATVFGHSPADGTKFAADIWEIKTHPAERIHLKNIHKHRNDLLRKRAECEQQLESAASDEEKRALSKKVEHYNDIIAEKPIRIRRLWGCLWIMLRWGFPLPIPVRVRPNWAEFSPIAAYALLNDARIRERK